MSAMEQQVRSTLARRGFLSVFVAGASVVGARTSSVATAVATVEPEEDQRGSRYKESEHIRTYYRVNRS
jgi:hypothetical protein